MTALILAVLAASAAAAPAASGVGQRPPVENRRPILDHGHRVEVRSGIWRTPRFSFHEPAPDVHTGSVDFAFGVEYLRSVTEDVALGIGAMTRVRGVGERVEHGDHWSAGGATVMVPFVVRWDFAHRATRWRVVEPYLTAGVGPLARTDWTGSEVDGEHAYDSDTEIIVGARLGAGFDAHIGSVWTVGVQAAWNWSQKPNAVVGYGRHDRGGEVAITMGWVFGRRSSWRD